MVRLLCLIQQELIELYRCRIYVGKEDNCPNRHGYKWRTALKLSWFHVTRKTADSTKNWVTAVYVCPSNYNHVLNDMITGRVNACCRYVLSLCRLFVRKLGEFSHIQSAQVKCIAAAGIKYMSLYFLNAIVRAHIYKYINARTSTSWLRYCTAHCSSGR